MHAGRMSFKAAAAAVLLVAATWSSGAFRAAEAMQLQDPGECKGECGCVWDPTGQYALCVYLPDTYTCTSDACCGG
jgi:hypothetical protein